MNSTRKLTEGSLLLAIFAVLLLITLYVPIVSLISNFFLSLPFIYIAWKNDWKGIGVFFIAALIISFIVGNILAIPLAFLFGTTGIVLGYLSQKKKSRFALLVASTLVVLVNVILQYAAAVVLFEINFVKEMMTLIERSFETSTKLLEATGQATNVEKLRTQVDLMIKMFETLLPSLLVMASLMVAFIIQVTNFPILKRFGVKLPQMKPFREFTLPKSILWYYLIAVILMLIAKPEEGTYLYMALSNLAFILQFLLVFQGIAFIYFVSFLKGWPKAVPIMVTILIFFIPLLLYIIRILGIIDLGFDLRKRMSQPKE